MGVQEIDKMPEAITELKRTTLERPVFHFALGPAASLADLRVVANGQEVELTPHRGTWRGAAGPAMNIARREAAATLLPNGKVLIAGGIGQTGELNSTELYDPATTPTTPMGAFGASNPMDAARFDAAIVVLPDSQVLIAGGFGSAGAAPSPLSATDLYTE